VIESAAQATTRGILKTVGRRRSKVRAEKVPRRAGEGEAKRRNQETKGVKITKVKFSQVGMVRGCAIAVLD